MQDSGFKRLPIDTPPLVNVSITPSSVLSSRSSTQTQTHLLLLELKRSRAVHELHQSGLRRDGKKVQKTIRSSDFGAVGLSSFCTRRARGRVAGLSKTVKGISPQLLSAD